MEWHILRSNVGMRSMKRGFHMISFETKSAHVPLFVNEHFEHGAKASIIIGTNGSGKSRVLAAIADELCNIKAIVDGRDDALPSLRIRSSQLSLPRQDGDLTKGVTTGRFDMRLSYWLDGSVWSVERHERTLAVSRDGREVPASEVVLPDKVLAIAHLPMDRFRFAGRDEDGFYQYLGLRQSTNMTSTGAIETSTFFSFLTAIREGTTSRLSEHWFPYLNLELPIYGEITVEPRSLALMRSFQEFVAKAVQYLSRRNSPVAGMMEENRQAVIDDLEIVWSLIRSLRDYSHHVPSSRGTTFRFEILPSFPAIGGDLDYFVKALEIGRRLRLFGGARLCFHKQGRLFTFGDLSSGEQHILSTVTGIVANLAETSAVFIDEPEVSLHPAWQIQYVPSLLQTLAAYPATHVVIATHSHFLVSDLQQPVGSLTVAGGPSDRAFEAYDGDVFGRSPDNILYRVFGIGTSGNSYVEHDLTIALEMISGTRRRNLAELGRIYRRLVPIAAPDNPALAEILRSIEAYLGENNNAEA
ncbi:AAA domain-containing protein (plasmid) [Rhizobium sp. CIAT894]|nr:AAA domain-containing protein [Rhizobium sp. CIAT894]